MAEEAESQSAGQRRPQDADLPEILERIWSGKSLRAACRELGLHVPSTSDWLSDDEGRCEQYARAKEGRAEYFQEMMLELGVAASTGQEVEVGGKAVKVDAAGLRVLLEGIKWAAARMAPKAAPIKRVEFLGNLGTKTDDEIAARIEALEAQASGEA